MWPLFLASLHGIFVVAVGFVTKSKSATVLAAIIAAVVAVMIGDSAYSFMDLTAVCIGLWFGFVGIGSPRASKPEVAVPLPTADRNGGKKAGSSASTIFVIGLLAAAAWIFYTPAKPILFSPASPPQMIAPPVADIAPPVADIAPPGASPSRRSISTPRTTSTSPTRVRRQPVALVPKQTPTSPAQPEIAMSVPLGPGEPVRNTRDVSPAFYPAPGSDLGNHPGFQPTCRWVTPTQWSCH